MGWENSGAREGAQDGDVAGHSQSGTAFMPCLASQSVPGHQVLWSSRLALLQQGTTPSLVLTYFLQSSPSGLQQMTWLASYTFQAVIRVSWSDRHLQVLQTAVCQAAVGRLGPTCTHG